MQGLEEFEISRAGVPRMMVTVTDGLSNNISDTIMKATEVKNNFIYSIVVGIDIDQDEEADMMGIEAIATDQESILLYDTTQNIVADHLLNRVCPGMVGVVGCGESVVYLVSQGCPTDIGLHLGKACCPCSR